VWIDGIDGIDGGDSAASRVSISVYADSFTTLPPQAFVLYMHAMAKPVPSGGSSRIGSWIDESLAFTISTPA